MIYEQRPKGCRDYDCLWKLRPAEVPEWMRPLQSRVVLDFNEDETGVTVLVDPEQPDAWKHPNVIAYLGQLCERMPVVISTGGQFLKIEVRG